MDKSTDVPSSGDVQAIFTFGALYMHKTLPPHQSHRSGCHIIKCWQRTSGFKSTACRKIKLFRLLTAFVHSRQLLRPSVTTTFKLTKSGRNLICECHNIMTDSKYLENVAYFEIFVKTQTNQNFKQEQN